MHTEENRTVSSGFKKMFAVGFEPVSSWLEGHRANFCATISRFQFLQKIILIRIKRLFKYLFIKMERWEARIDEWTNELCLKGIEWMRKKKIFINFWNLGPIQWPKWTNPSLRFLRVVYFISILNQTCSCQMCFDDFIAKPANRKSKLARGLAAEVHWRRVWTKGSGSVPSPETLC